MHLWIKVLFKNYYEKPKHSENLQLNKTVDISELGDKLKIESNLYQRNRKYSNISADILVQSLQWELRHGEKIGCYEAALT